MVEIIRHQILKTVYILTFCFTFFSPTPTGVGGVGGGCVGGVTTTLVCFPFWIELYKKHYIIKIDRE